MPGCLIELGFITTPDEERLLNDDGRVDDIARSIYEAFARYKNKYDRSVSVPYRAKNSEEVNLPKIVPDQEPAPKTRVVTRGKQPKREEATPEQPKRVEKKVKRAEVADAPVFKLQIFVGSRNLRKGDAHFKGETDYDSFQEGNLVKYTLGASTDYNEIYRLRKEKLEKFPEAFIIAFKNGQKYDVNQAIREFKQNRNR